MSRDKYSEDHTISVDKGNGTLTVDGSVNITGDFGFDSAITQRVRYSGVAFRPDASNYNHITYSSNNGRLNFSNTEATVYCPVTEIPHGATIIKVRVVASAVGTDDSVVTSLRKVDGSFSESLVTITIANEGAGVTDETADLGSPNQIDLTEDKAYMIKVVGIEDSSDAALRFIDVIYTIQTFPQDSESSPT